MVAAVPRATERIIGHIPRMEGVQQVIKDVGRRFDADDDRGPSLGGRMLRIVRDHDELESRGATRVGALEAMGHRSGAYDPQLLLIARGYKVTPALLGRLAHIPRGQVRKPLRVIAGSPLGEPAR